MAYVRKIKGSLVKLDSSEYVGEDSYIFYDIETGCLRRTDGTPGGTPICIEGMSKILEFPTFGDFPQPGESNTIYIAADTNLIYRWDGSQYVSLVSLGDDDNVQELPTVGDFPATGTTDVIYIAADTNLLYRWDGSNYVLISNDHESATVVNILPTETKTVIVTVPGGNLSAKYIVSILDQADGRFASSEVMASYKTLDNSVSHNHYSLLGDKIKYRPDVLFNTSYIELTITNNDTNPITASVSRIPSISV